MYDVLVAGAGPAGAVLAYHLARAGLQVALVEKDRLPRYKACGGGLPLKTIQSLPFEVDPVLDCQAAGATLSYAGRELLRAPLNPGWGWFAMRERLDYFLVQKAVDAGAELRDGMAVREIEPRPGHVVACAAGQSLAGRPHVERLRARFVAGADGVLSTVARSIGLLPERAVGVAIEAEVEVPPDVLDRQAASATFDFGALPRGYGWIFPKASHLSAGVFRAWPGKAPGLRRCLDAFLASQAALRNGHCILRRGHLIPLGGSREPLHRGRVLLVGDAANLADPWLGEGIYYAVWSARLAAEILEAAMESGAGALARYSARVQAEITPAFRQARRLAALVYRQPHFCSVLLSRSPAIQELVFGTIRGDVSLRQLNRKLARNLPRILVEAARGGQNPP